MRYDDLHVRYVCVRFISTLQFDVHAYGIFSYSVGGYLPEGFQHNAGSITCRKSDGPILKQNMRCCVGVLRLDW